MYYVNCRFDKIGECILELSVNIPNSDGTSSEELLNSKKVNVKKGANLLVDGVLVKDIENKVKEKTTIDYKELKYHVKISEYSNGEKGTGVGSKWKLFKSNLE